MSFRRRRKRKKSRNRKGFLGLSETTLTRHHKKPKCKGGTWARQNIALIPAKQHAAWHVLFYTFDAYAIASIINKWFIDPAYRLSVQEVANID